MKRPVPFAIMGSMVAPGLGCVHWWRNEVAEEDGEAQGGAEIAMDVDRERTTYSE
jgi:hypothetical protein